ncbi:type IV secretion protein Rhs [Flavobacterium psychroterrae]|uniref:Type IV secretion protein Rhs n=1 Tax=Flavobacterium psychroterrae TaxID=2133767 RepID=A0ABS5P9L5_9FLAO|nr:phage baseplate assembly protein V [Flavobacterium psychroterrae]MBS7230938.1 type IV secretion protein Rhs [Flavobacterium psychroterrae]
MSKFSEQVHITIDGFTQTVIYYDLELSQAVMDHHYFSFVWQYTGQAIIKPADQAKALRTYKGMEVIFTFKSLNGGIRLMSKGFITGLKSIDIHGSPVGLHVKGTSHTVLLDDLAKSRIFLDRNLQEIAVKIFSEETAGEFYQIDAIKPTNTKYFDYKPQYNETSFNFLKRLSARHAQWFYFDGMRIQFGQLKTSKVKLINGSSLHEFGIETKLISHKASFTGYDYNDDKHIFASQLKTNSGSADSFSRVALDRQSSVSQPDLSVAGYTNQAKNADEISEMAKLKTAGRDANSVFYTGVSYLPIGVGQVFTIQNQTVEHELIAIEVIHQSEVHGNYTCKFRAIPADVAAPHYTNVDAFASAASQSARVIDNNDPEKMGRIKVAFYWTGGDNESEWMRMTQQYSGEGRGIYCRPEIGDEVLVDFEGGNIDRPYISGSHYNGKAKPEFFDPKNMIKGFKFRFGQLLKFVEKTGIWLSDPSGNELHLDEVSKNMNLTSVETITFNCKNFIVNASEGITYNAGTHIAETAIMNKTTNIGGVLHTSVGGDKTLHVVGDSYKQIDGESNSEVKKGRNISTESKIIIQSESGHEFHSDQEIKNNSGEGTRLN